MHYLTRIFCIALLILPSVDAVALRNIAFNYDANPPIGELHAFDAVVVQPQSTLNPQAFQSNSNLAYAYVNVGEIDNAASYAKQINKSWIIGSNHAWQSTIMDIANPAWQNFLLDQVITPLWQKGYRGFFLDTLDSYADVLTNPKQQTASIAGEVNFIKQIKAKYPDAHIILNRGFNLLPQVHNLVTAVAAESLFYGWDQAAQHYSTIPLAERNQLLQQLTIVKQMGLPVVVIDYLPPNQRAMARDDAAKIAALGFIPYVTDSTLTGLGISNIEVMPRKILMLYGGETLFDSEVLNYATTPLNYEGYIAQYRNLDEPLPEGVLTGRYAGIIIWQSQDSLPDWKQLYHWALTQMQNGIPVVFLGSFGFPLNDATLKPLSLKPYSYDAQLQKLHISYQSPLANFEIQPYPEAFSQYMFNIQAGQLLLQIADDSGHSSDVAAITPWGGYALNPYVLKTLPNNENRWEINPLEFFRLALRLPTMPIPDPTTENGRRLMMVHVDGDAFISRVEWKPQWLAGKAIEEEIFKRFHIPTTASVIVGEVAPYGVDPKDSAEAMQDARSIFALPWIEIASHTFSHPFQWQEAETKSKGGEGEEYTLKIPNYKFNLKTEITGSIDFINQYLAPPGKKCKVLLWSGDASPDYKPLALAYADGIANMNRGDTVITNDDNSITEIAPLGLEQNGYFQVFAPNQNENVYTNDWQGPYYGFIRVIETFKLTDKPYRFKPIDIYYHFYSGTKMASLNALKQVYEWALSQPVMNIYVSEYFKKVLDFNSINVARAGNAWLIQNQGDLRELRVSQSIGTPDMIHSQNLVGYSRYGNDYYLHLGPATTSVLYFLAPRPLPLPATAASPIEAQWIDVVIKLMDLPYIGPAFKILITLPSEQGAVPYLEDANGRVTAFMRTSNGIQFSLESYLPLKFTLANMQGCTLLNAGKEVQGQFSQTGSEQFTLMDLKANALTVICSS